MPEDVIIYSKNGEGGTPIIHRAIMRVVAEQTVEPNRSATAPCPEEATYDEVRVAGDGLPGSCILTWSVPGTSVRDVVNITVHFDGTDAAYYDCKRPAHSGENCVVEPYLVVWQWAPSHEGMLTLGDNNKCSVDQGAGVRTVQRAFTARRAWLDPYGTPGSSAWPAVKSRGWAR